jgi:hypothetical protein
MTTSLRPALLLALVFACSAKEPTDIISPDVIPPKKDAKPAPAKDAAATPPSDPNKGNGSTADAGGTADSAASDASANADSENGPVIGGDGGIASDGGSASDAGPVAGSDGGPVTAPTMEATWSHTMCNKKALMFPKIDKNNGVFPIGSCPPPDDLNRACGGNSKIKVAMAEAQSWETGYVHPPGYAIDEYIMTRWSSNTMATSYIIFDLGSEQSFKRLYLAWELSHAADYDIVTSNDKTTWTMLKQVRGGNGFQDILDVEGKARYIRMNGLKRGEIGEGPYGYSLFDFTVCAERP